MRWREKVEVGLKIDAPFRKDKPYPADNLLPSHISGPEPSTSAGRLPEIAMSCNDDPHATDAPMPRIDDLPPQD